MYGILKIKNEEDDIIVLPQEIEVEESIGTAVDGELTAEDAAINTSNNATSSQHFDIEVFPDGDGVEEVDESS